MTQVDSLPADARRMLEALAVLTEPVDRRLLAQVANVHDSPRSALDRLASAYLALEDLGRWSVRHSIIREVICAHLSEAEKRALHAAAAAAIRTAAPTEDSRRAEFLALAAFHATAARAEREALLDHLEAARAAIELGQTELADRQAELALEQARARPDILETSDWDLAQVENLAAGALSTARPPSSTAPVGSLEEPQPGTGIEPAIERLVTGLTSRERDVIELIARGASNRDIARELVITEKTASIHVSNIIGKLGVRRRGEVAALVHQARQGRAV